MTNSDAIGEFAEVITQQILTYLRAEACFIGEFENEIRKKIEEQFTALISEHYVAKEAAGYPLEFVEWLIKDQEIFFGELNEEYILNDNIHAGGRKLQTIDELFNYWKENER